MTRSPRLLTTLAAGLLLVAGCGQGAGPPTSDSSQDGRPADLGTADLVFTRPVVSDAGEFTVATTAGFTDYNNNTGAANSLQNAMVLSTVQPSPFFFDRVDGRIVLKRDGDLMDSVEVTSTDPMQLRPTNSSKATSSDPALGPPLKSRSCWWRCPSSHSRR